MDKEEEQMTDNEEQPRRKLGGCGVTTLGVILAIVLGIAAGVIYTLFMIGSWIGQQ